MSDIIPTSPTRHASEQPAAQPAPGVLSSASPSESVKSAAIPMGRLIMAFAVAVIADTVGFPLGEIGFVVFDICVGVVLMGIIGFRRGISPELVVATVVEAIPGLGLLPSWVAAVGVLAARSRYARGRPKA